MILRKSSVSPKTNYSVNVYSDVMRHFCKRPKGMHDMQHLVIEQNQKMRSSTIFFPFLSSAVSIIYSGTLNIKALVTNISRLDPQSGKVSQMIHFLNIRNISHH